jgi:oxygen-independent coproporphyrinogen-3 oxidase
MAGLEREIAAFLRRKDAAGFRPATVFFGGGTPTWLEAEELAALATLLRRRFDLSGVEEWSCEANPGTVTAEKFAVLRESGANRISVGVQSFDGATLRRLGRIHDGDEARAAVAAARAAGFAHVGVDLIYGVPGDAEGRIERDVAEAGACGADHLSCYCLEFEEGTPFWRRRPRGEAARALAERQWREYGAIRRLARTGGWRQYELSNFAKNGAVCAHNLLYWSGGDYLGLGSGAHSHWRGERWGNTRGTGAWRRAFSERLAPEAAARETLVMGLRRTAGWNLAAFRELTGFDAMDLRGEEIRRAVEAGNLVSGKGRLRLASRALFSSDAVFADLV